MALRARLLIKAFLIVGFLPWVTLAQSSRPFRPGVPGRPLESQASASADSVSMGSPRWAGNGCSRGSASAALSPDKTALSVVFDRFVVQLSHGLRQQQRLNCTLHLPFEVPKNRQVSVVRLDYRGFNYVPKGAQSELRAWYKFVGPGSPTRGAPTEHYKKFIGPLDDTFFVSSKQTQQVWSVCGRHFQLVSHSQLAATLDNEFESLMSAIDSLDATVEDDMVYHLTWRECRD